MVGDLSKNNSKTALLHQNRK